ncbi:hypothetical protein AAG906_018893 [Vitis piasezkii]
MSSSGGEFMVTVRRKEVVAAMLPMQKHWLPLSNLDLLLPPIDVAVFFCYKKPRGSASGASLQQPRVDFLEAYADVKLQDLNLYNPDESIEGKLAPTRKHGVLSVQVTELKCGGIVVACTFDHRIADAYSTNMFLVSWAEMAQSKPLSVIPSFRRSLLNPRHPGSYAPSLDHMYVPISALPPPKVPQPGADPLISRLYYVTAEKLSLLQTLATSKSSSYKRTKLESLSAFLWKMVAKSAHMENANQKICKMSVVVDGRKRLSSGDEDMTTAMASYFGNVLSFPFGEKIVNDLKERPLSWVGDEVHDFLEAAMTKEHFLGLIDWVEAHRPEPATLNMPALGSYHFPWGEEVGYVMPMPSPTVDGDWVVYMHLLKAQIELIETEAADIFSPLTADHLNLLNAD